MAESAPPIPEVADSLALAVVLASEAPVLLLDGKSVIIASSASFGRAFEIDEHEIVGRSLSQLGFGEWDMPELTSLLAATMSEMSAVGVFEADLVRSGRSERRLALRARKLVFGHATATRILLTVTDLTEARTAETLSIKLLQQKTILLQELQHRVANSLQIIASILMQSARHVQSEEVRTHLYEAHSRVVSICAIQQHLTSDNLDDVEMRPYLNDLCRSIAASLISNAERNLSLEVDADGSSATADVSISIGLVVTELVINALKHAFPDRQDGRILVKYDRDDDDWTLSVADNGIGIWGDPALRKPGLGSSIVTAIAGRLSARVERTDNKPGTKVSLIYADADAPLHA